LEKTTHHNTLHKTIPESLKATSEELFSIWNCAQIPTAFQPNIVSKMKRLIEDYNLLKKNKENHKLNETANSSLFAYTSWAQDH